MTMNDMDLDRRLDALPRAADTPEALWPAIERRIAHRTRRRWLAGIAAAVVMTVLAALIARNLEDFRPPDLTTTVSLAATVIAAEISAMDHAAPDAEQVAGTGFDKGWKAAWDLNQAAITELEHALKESPDNRLLLDFLARARLRESELVNQTMAGAALVSQRSN